MTVKIRQVDYAGLRELVSRYPADTRYDTTFFDGMHPESMAALMGKGEPELHVQAEKLFGDVLSALMPETDEGFNVQRVASPVGSFPNVGAFLAGRPDSMFGVEPQDELGPVRLFVDLLCQQTLERPAMLARGLAIAALAYALQTVRPVELYLTTISRQGGRGNHLGVICRMGVSPFDLTSVATAISHTAIGRMLLHDPDHPHDEIYGSFSILDPRKTFKLEDGDVYFPALREYEQDAWKNDPVSAMRGQCADQLDCLVPCETRGDGAQ